MTGSSQSGNPQLAYNTDAEMREMREDIVNRRYRLDIISKVISIGTGAAGIVLMFAGGSAALLGGLALAVGGPLLTTLFTKKEEERLRIDQEFLESRMQGGNWGRGHWRGYREEVAEHGHGIGADPAALQGSRPPQVGSRPGGSQRGSQHGHS